MGNVEERINKAIRSYLGRQAAIRAALTNEYYTGDLTLKSAEHPTDEDPVSTMYVFDLNALWEVGEGGVLRPNEMPVTLEDSWSPGEDQVHPYKVIRLATSELATLVAQGIFGQVDISYRCDHSGSHTTIMPNSLMYINHPEGKRVELTMLLDPRIDRDVATIDFLQRVPS